MTRTSGKKKMRFHFLHFLQDKTIAAPIQTLLMISTSETSDNPSKHLHPSFPLLKERHSLICRHGIISCAQNLDQTRKSKQMNTCWAQKENHGMVLTSTSAIHLRPDSHCTLEKHRQQALKIGTIYSFPLSQDSNIFHKVKTQLLLPDGVMFHRWYTSLRPAQTVGTAFGFMHRYGRKET